jgi:D-xylose reductase
MGLVVTAYSSFGPPGYVEMDLEHAVKTPHLFKSEIIRNVGKAHGKSPPQVLLRWATQQGVVVILKSDTLEQLLDNINAKDFDLTEKENKEISSLNQNLRLNDPLIVNLPQSR